MKNEKIKSLLISFLWISLIIMVVVFIGDSFLFIFDAINGKVTLSILFKKIFVAIVLLGYAALMYILLGIANSFKESAFIRANVKRFNYIGYIFFIEALVQAIYSSIVTPGHDLFEILGINVTIEVVSLAIISLTFFFIADVFDKAIKIKEVNDLTI